MIAFFFALQVPSLSQLGGIAIVLGLAILVAHLANPKVKRLAIATLMAIVVASVAIRADDESTGSPADAEIVFVNPCDRHEPWSPMWILLGCMWPW